MTVTWTIDATRSFKRIFAYRKKTGSLASAKKLRVELFYQTRLLETFPRMGKSAENRKIKNHEIRVIIKEHFQIYYRIQEDKNEVQILFVSDSRSLKKPPFIEN